MPDFSTPMMKQYKEIKSRYKDCLLFYRMGDFYELFMEDAHIGSKVLSITLTSKAGGKDGKIPMAGIPYHAVDSYLAKLVQAGYKVAICEQLSPPNKKGLVKRDVIRVVTPGTMMDEKALDQKTHNYIIGVSPQDSTIGLAIADLSTGFFATTQYEGNHKEMLLLEEIAKLSPSECILPDYLYNDASFLQLLRKEKQMNVSCFQEWDTFTEDAEKFLQNHFGLKTLAAFGLSEKGASIVSSAALLGYLQTTQLSKVHHIQKLQYYTQGTTMMLDKSTILNLELFSTIREHDTSGSLLAIIDETKTAMGGRLLKDWVKKPLVKKDDVVERHNGVEELWENTKKRSTLIDKLEHIIDIERILSRLSVNIGNARDVNSLKIALQGILGVKKELFPLTAPLFQKVQKQISDTLTNVITVIEKTITEDPPIELREGKIIKPDIHKELDSLRKIIANSKNFIEELEQKERQATGISSLKIRYNQVFGFYIEVSKANTHLVPKSYMRKQTLVNGERFITEELKKHEEIILTAEEKANDLEYTIFQETLSKVLSYTKEIQQAADAIAITDCIANFAHISQQYNYVRPKLLYSGEIRIHQGRHPVVERLLSSDNQFVPNDVTLDNINQSLLIITGPNMAGKSVFIRQVATIVLLNQIGCFVPAQSAHLSLVDRIFVRSGASDVITSGLSTFMVEMVETAYILHNATERSLIIMDEIGRGTSTYDGISIAWAVAQYIVTAFPSSPKTLFATHYHELQALEDHYPNNIKNYHMAVADDKGNPLFLHTILPGGASHSFGVAVAKLAGIPLEVIESAKEMLHILENRDNPTNVILGNEEGMNSESKKKRSWTPSQGITSEQRVNQDDTMQQPIVFHLIQKELEHIDIATMTPLEALNKLAELKDQLKLLQSESTEFFEAD